MCYVPWRSLTRNPQGLQRATYVDEGCSALDEVDGFLPVALTWWPAPFDSSTAPSQFLLTCTAVDRAGNVATKQRRVAVLARCSPPSFLCPLPSAACAQCEQAACLCTTALAEPDQARYSFGLALGDREWPLNDGQIQNPSGTIVDCAAI